MCYRNITLQVFVLSTFIIGAVGGEPAASIRRAGPFPLPGAERRNLEVLAYDNGDVSPWAEFFSFDSPGHAKLVQFRSEYKLDEVIAAAKSDLERAVALKRWVGAHWKFRTPEPETFRDWSAVTLLERGKQGKWGWCGQAAILFQQACIVVGLPARFIELGNETSPACHFTTEVYLREQGKWAVIDSTPLPDFDLYYTVGGVPQSALEMHRRVVRGSMDGVSEVHPDGASPVQGRKSPAWTISEAEVVDWRPTDRVRMSVRPSETQFFVHLWSADLDFDHFEVAIDGRDWERLPECNTPDASGSRFGWSAKRCSFLATTGFHEAHARLVRHTGTKGPESFVKLRVTDK